MTVLFCILFLLNLSGKGQPAPKWIRPVDEKSEPVGGLPNKIVVALWPASLEKDFAGRLTGGPRGLLRIGYEYKGSVYLINYIAVEPVVGDEMEFSEVSPSVADEQWGKLFWAANNTSSNYFSPNASAR